MSCNEKDSSCGFHCTGYDGKQIWKELHSLPQKIDCEECSDHADFEFKGLHDHVNAGLGKKPFDGTKYKKWVDEVKCTYDKCVQDGRCS